MPSTRPGSSAFRAAAAAPLLTALLLAACQAGGASAPASAEASVPPSVEASAPESMAEPSDEASMAPGPELAVEESEAVGEFVVDPEGRTLYIFTSDSEGVSTCTEQCAVNWPPFTVEEGEEPAAGEEVTGTLSTIERDDGSLQVTLENWPLYYFAGDEAPGEVNGEGVGDVWYVARPDGSTPADDSGDAGDY